MPQCPQPQQGILCVVKWAPSWPISPQRIVYVLNVGLGAMGSPWFRADKGTSGWWIVGKQGGLKDQGPQRKEGTGRWDGDKGGL